MGLSSESGAGDPPVAQVRLRVLPTTDGRHRRTRGKWRPERGHGQYPGPESLCRQGFTAPGVGHRVGRRAAGASGWEMTAQPRREPAHRGVVALCTPRRHSDASMRVGRCPPFPAAANEPANARNRCSVNGPDGSRAPFGVLCADRRGYCPAVLLSASDATAGRRSAARGARRRGERGGEGAGAPVLCRRPRRQRAGGMEGAAPRTPGQVGDRGPVALDCPGQARTAPR